MIQTAAELLAQPAEFQDMVRKNVISHAVNELASAQQYDEPAIALAPSSYWKWQTCRIAMEEYGHHLKFLKLGRALGVPDEAMIPGREKASLNIIAPAIGSWAQYVTFKFLADMAELIQIEDLLECSYAPLRKVLAEILPEERFHTSFGRRACAELPRDVVQPEIDKLFPQIPAFFGAPNSKNSALYRKWGIKQRTNEAMAAEYVVMARERVEKLGLTVPDLEAR